MSESRVCAILLAGGLGSRMKLNSTKQTLLILGQSVLKRTLLAFENCDEITDIVLVTREEEYAFATSESSDIKKVRKIVFGGKTRSESAKNGFLSIDFPCDFVAVHDVARCMILPDMITKVIKNAKKYGAASASSTVTDTVKRVDEEGFIVKTENRDELRFASTPQVFKYALYSRAINEIDILDPSVTDDNLLMEKIGVKVYMTDVGSRNIKLTNFEDIAYIEYLLTKD